MYCGPGGQGSSAGLEESSGQHISQGELVTMIMAMLGANSIRALASPIAAPSEEIKGRRVYMSIWIDYVFR
jgi:hypothetical protein